MVFYKKDISIQCSLIAGLFAVVLFCFSAGCSGDIHTSGFQLQDSGNEETDTDTGESEEDDDDNDDDNNDNGSGELEDAGDEDTGAEYEDANFLDGGSDIGCETDFDCHFGYACVDNKCVTLPEECEIDIDCPVGFICTDNKCKRPLDDDGGSSDIPCVRNEDCGTGGECIDGKCHVSPFDAGYDSLGEIGDECADLLDCRPPLDCVENICIHPDAPEDGGDFDAALYDCYADSNCKDPALPYCVDRMCVECRSDGDCPEFTAEDGGAYDMLCILNYCQKTPPACHSNFNCPENYICVDYQCALRPPDDAGDPDDSGGDTPDSESDDDDDDDDLMDAGDIDDDDSDTAP